MNQLITICRAISSPYQTAIFIALFSILICPPLMADGRNAVSALGFVEPQGGIINIGGFTSSTGAIVSDLLIAEGDVVEKGQVLAILDTHDILQANMKLAEADVEILKARLKSVKAGASQGTINAQQAKIGRLKAELDIADAKCRRAKTLHAQKIIPDAALEDECLKKNVLKAQISEASATLSSIKEVRKVDVAVVLAELGKAEAAVLKAKAESERSVFRAPSNGRVLKLHVRPGELISAQGILQLGQTESMWIRAEIYETDISKVQVGQQVTVTSDGFPGKILGTVKDIGLMIGKNRLDSLKSSTGSDSRVVEVKIKLNESGSSTVAQLTNLQVTVVIHTGSKQ